MELNGFKPLDFPGASIAWGEDHYIVHSERPLEFLSSATLVGWLVGDAVYHAVGRGMELFKRRGYH